MLVQILSDLHFESYRTSPELGDVGIHPQAEAIILAGDIDMGENAMVQAERIARRSNKPVIFVPGNHEYYGQDYQALSKKFKNSVVTGVAPLLNTTFVLYGVRFIGTTLWTDFELYSGTAKVPTVEHSMEDGQDRLCDFRRIRYGNQAFFASTSREIHKESYAYLEQMLNTPFDGKTVVITHHAPHPQSIHSRYAASELMLNSNERFPNVSDSWRANPCFASDLTELVSLADYWVHGHVHDSFDYMVGKCRVIANPRGYPIDMYNNLRFENQNFNPALLLDI